MTTRSPSIFDSFNAKPLSAQEVASTFIPPEQFADLVLRANSVVMGPRGSGKTTLLKMLQLSALNEWCMKGATDFIDKVDFVGVFVAADLSWGAQLNAIKDEAEYDPKFLILFSEAAFVTQCLVSLVTAMREANATATTLRTELSRLQVRLSRFQEAEIVSHIAKEANLENVVGSFSALIRALTQRLSDLGRFGTAIRRGHLKPESLPSPIRDYLTVRFDGAVRSSIVAFNEIAKRYDMRWCFLIDELEIVPDTIRKQLFDYLRGSFDNLLFKLSISPIAGELGTLGPIEKARSGQDFNVVPLWNAKAEWNYSFCDKLTRSMIGAAGVNASPEDIFGISFGFGDQPEEVKSERYKVGGSMHGVLKRLELRDPSFRAYLRKQSVDINQLDTLPEVERAAVIRKVMPIVRVREAFRREQLFGVSGNAKLRSRKNEGLYFGIPTLYTVSEGNPRLLIGLLRPLIEQYKAQGQRINQGKQNGAIRSVGDALRALLKGIPVEQPAAAREIANLDDLVEKIGSALNRAVVQGDFMPEPPLTIEIDSVPKAYQEGIRRAVNIGALILVDRNEPIISDVYSHRLRLSHLLAAYYKLPLVLGPEIKLSKLLAAPSLLRREPDLLSGAGNES